MTEVRAHQSNISISPVKLRLVIDQVRGMEAKKALTVLEYMPQKGAHFVYKTVASALSNAENNSDLDPELMVISEIWAGEGPRLKRFKAGARGRYKPRVKRTAHLTVILSEREA
jgi:large subunit ribosomal protein L22